MKSVFVKYMLCFLGIFIASFTILFFIVVGMVSSNERSESVDHAVRSVKVLIDKSYMEYFDEEGVDNYHSFIKEEIKSIEIQITGISECTNTVIFITDHEGNIDASSSMSGLNGKKLPYDVISKFKGSVGEDHSFAGDLGGLFDGKYSVRGIGLATGEEKAVAFACVPLEGVSDFVKSILGTMMDLVVLVLIAGMIACYFITERITVPLKEMSRAAKAFSKGNFDVRVQVAGNDEIAELATTMNSMAESLYELEKMRSNFLANVSHDLRTPMTTISGFIDGILDGAIPEDKHEYYLEIIRAEVRRLSRLVGTLLDISRIQAGERKFERKDFDICEKAREVLISNESRIDKKKLDIEFEAENDNMFAIGDVDAVHQVIYNLVDNAIKFSYDGGKLRISIRDVDSKLIRFEVYNEGKGIPDEDIRHVFDRFYKADKSRGLDKTGVGLGLYISRTIIEAMGGSITVESKEGEWCSFRFTLPKGSTMGRLAELDDVE